MKARGAGHILVVDVAAEVNYNLTAVGIQKNRTHLFFMVEIAAVLNVKPFDNRSKMSDFLIMV